MLEGSFTVITKLLKLPEVEYLSEELFFNSDLEKLDEFLFKESHFAIDLIESS